MPSAASSAAFVPVLASGSRAAERTTWSGIGAGGQHAERRAHFVQHTERIGSDEDPDSRLECQGEFRVADSEAERAKTAARDSMSTNEVT